MATNLAYELVDLMRSQRSQASYYNAITPPSFAGVVAPAGGCARAAVTTPAANIARWKCEVSRTLPEGKAQVTIQPNGELTVEVQWDDVNWNSSGVIGVSNVQIRSRL